MFSLICVWINGWVNNREARDLRRHRGHYDVNVMNQSRFWYLTGPNKLRRPTVYSYSDKILTVKLGSLKMNVLVSFFSFSSLSDGTGLGVLELAAPSSSALLTADWGAVVVTMVGRAVGAAGDVGTTVTVLTICGLVCGLAGVGTAIGTGPGEALRLAARVGEALMAARRAELVAAVFGGVFGGVDLGDGWNTKSNILLVLNVLHGFGSISYSSHCGSTTVLTRIFHPGPISCLLMANTLHPYISRNDASSRLQSQFKFNGKLMSLYVHSWLRYRYKFLHVPRHYSCHVLCKTLSEPVDKNDS